jgi:hypothetical protein
LKKFITAATTKASKAHHPPRDKAARPASRIAVHKQPIEILHHHGPKMAFQKTPSSTPRRNTAMS